MRVQDHAEFACARQPRAPGSSREIKRGSGWGVTAL